MVVDNNNSMQYRKTFKMVLCPVITLVKLPSKTERRNAYYPKWTLQKSPTILIHTPVTISLGNFSALKILLNKSNDIEL